VKYVIEVVLLAFLFHSFSGLVRCPSIAIVTYIISLPDGNMYLYPTIQYLSILMKHFVILGRENIKEISISNMHLAHIVCARRTRSAEQVVAAFQSEAAHTALFDKLKFQ
jgi:hypothetical protein